MRRGIITAKDTLTKLLYISYMVPTQRIAPRIPHSLELATARNAAFISIVIFDNSRFKFNDLPIPGLEYGEINIRTYVYARATGEYGMYLLDSGITSQTVRLVANAARIPWQHLRLEIETSTDHADSYVKYAAAGAWGGLYKMIAAEVGRVPIALPPFSSVDQGLEFLTRPLIGFYSVGKEVYRLHVSHALIVPRVMELAELHFPRLLDSGVLNSDELANPHSVLLVPEVEFTAYVPQRRYA